MAHSPKGGLYGPLYKRHLGFAPSTLEPLYIYIYVYIYVCVFWHMPEVNKVETCTTIPVHKCAVHSWWVLCYPTSLLVF